MSGPVDRPRPRQAPPELRILQQFEDLTGWLLQRTARWPKSQRFGITQRLENHALDVLEHLVVARYHPPQRGARLHDANLTLERMRRLLRLARRTGACPVKTFESAVRQLDETGRMLYGWRHARGEVSR